ncbi:acyl carrier protein [Streptomyces sp. UH6]|uniref:acyl carrier protein n=1 Tax=Streptomyces sp. UH6 TaxID=2748379 RepID=UPI0015D4D81E|nr:acyl carrier protein [Streptomyces sp. UH6]NYV75896.1 acyl carrier protein [Streptomyces sp. UH6]
MTDQPLVARLEALLRDHFEIAPEAVRPEATFRELEIDSLAMAEILAILEDEDGISLPPTLPGLGGDTTLADGFRIIAEAAAQPQGETAGAAR